MRHTLMSFEKITIFNYVNYFFTNPKEILTSPFQIVVAICWPKLLRHSPPEPLLRKEVVNQMLLAMMASQYQPETVK